MNAVLEPGRAARPVARRLGRWPGGDGLAARVLSGTVWTGLAQLAARGFPLLAMLLAARILGRVHYGELGILLGSIAMFETVAAFGMGVTATRHIADYRHSQPDRIMGIVALTRWSTVVAGGLVTLAVFVTAPALAASAGIPTLAPLLRAGAALLFLQAMIAGNNGILAGFESFRAQAVGNAVAGAFSIPLVVGGAWHGGVAGTLAGLGVAALMNLVVGSILVARATRAIAGAGSSRVGRAELRLLLRFSLPAMATGLMVAPVNWAAGVMLVNQRGYGEMGLFTAAQQWFSVLLFLPGALTVVFLPILAGIGGTAGAAALGPIVWRGVRAILWTALLPALAVTVTSPWIMAWYGTDFVAGHRLLAVIALTALVAATQNMLSNALAVLDRMGLNLLANLAFAIANLAAVRFLLNQGAGAMALGLAALAAYALKLVITVAALGSYGRGRREGGR